MTFDLTIGYRYLQLNDHLEVDSSSTFLAGQSILPAGSVVMLGDHFGTAQRFQRRPTRLFRPLPAARWTLDTSLKIGVGQTNTKITIDGTTTSIIPGQATSVQPGGFLALPSNSGDSAASSFRSCLSWA